jgi:L,D-transpeptidase ErfK/SrfK
MQMLGGAASARRLLAVTLLCLVAAWSSVGWSTPAAARQDAPQAIVGGEFDHIVAKNETWRSIGSRYGTDAATLAALNGNSVTSPLRAGRTLRIDNRHLVPGTLADGIVINLPQRMLFLKRDGRVVGAYPVSAGRPTWPTFVGRFTVVTQERDPVWDVPPSIQEELRRAGKKVVTRVLPGPDNPLGKYWLGLSEPNFGIHGTIAPQSIFRFETHGCIRLHPDDIADLWPHAVVGTLGEVIYEPVLVRLVDGHVLLEAHADVYRRIADLEAELRGVIVAAGVVANVDWLSARRTLGDHDGRPHAIEIAVISR